MRKFWPWTFSHMQRGHQYHRPILPQTDGGTRLPLVPRALEQGPGPYTSQRSRRAGPGVARQARGFLAALATPEGLREGETAARDQAAVVLP